MSAAIRYAMGLAPITRPRQYGILTLNLDDWSDKDCWCVSGKTRKFRFPLKNRSRPKS